MIKKNFIKLIPTLKLKTISDVGVWEEEHLPVGILIKSIVEDIEKSNKKGLKPTSNK